MASLKVCPPVSRGSYKSGSVTFARQFFPLTLNFFPLILNLLKDGRKELPAKATEPPILNFFPLILNLLKDGRKELPSKRNRTINR